MNCLTCGTGSRWWLRDGTLCPECGGDPRVAGSGHTDWRERSRAGFVQAFGPRLPGDAGWAHVDPEPTLPTHW